MADPVVHLTAGVPDSGTGNITTLGQTLLDGANATLGVTTGAAVTTSVAGTLQQYLRGIVSLLVSGITVASHAVTNAGTFAVQVTSATGLAQASTSSGQTGSLIMGAVTTAAPSYTTAQTDALSMDTAGNLRVVEVNSASPIPAGTNVIGKTGIDQTTPGTTNAVALGQIGSTTVLAGNGTAGAGAQRVTIASDNTAFAVNATPTPATSGGLLRSRTLIPNNVTAIVVKSGAGQLYKIRATNNSATIAYIKLYDATSATAGSGTVVDTIMIPAATAGGAGVVDTTDIGVAHTTGITYCVTTGIADADTTAPAASAYIVTMYYK